MEIAVDQQLKEDISQAKHHTKVEEEVILEEVVIEVEISMIRQTQTIQLSNTKTRIQIQDLEEMHTPKMMITRSHSQHKQNNNLLCYLEAVVMNNQTTRIPRKPERKVKMLKKN